MTQTLNQVDSGLEPIMEPARRRRFIGRLSLGHLVMILAGLLAFLLVLIVLRDNSASSFFARAARDIPAGTTITAEDVELVEVGGDSLAGTVLTADDVNIIITGGQVSSRALAVGTLLQPSDFTVSGFTSEMRSMSIPTSPSRAVAGSLKPGDRVDVIATDDELSWFVAAGAEVLAVGEATAGGLSSNDYTITIAVDPELSLRLACGLENYRINFVRSTGAAQIELAAPPESCG